MIGIRANFQGSGRKMIIVAVQNNQNLPWESVISASCQPSYVITK